MIDDASVRVVFAAFSGLLFSALLERLIRPAPLLVRSWRAWALHIGLWCIPYSALVLLLGRPFFAATGVLAFFLMLILVSNAKMKALDEPFIYQDFEYFIDTIRFPRLYIPFMGWKKFSLATLGFVFALYIGLWGESVPIERFTWPGKTAGILFVSGAGILLLLAGDRFAPSLNFTPAQDLKELGLPAAIWFYAKEERVLPSLTSPYAVLRAADTSGRLPHMIAVQSESFFDPRSLYAGIQTSLLEEFDRVRAEAVCYGKLSVPAWGANTVRTEFAFLSGLDEQQLGVHRFNPYRAVARGWETHSIASFLQKLGYRTICIHPYPASFYRRARVFPKLGFDEFMDIHCFKGMPKFGPYISDLAVAEKIADLLQGAPHKTSQPLFIFAITMENHGPLYFERTGPEDVEALYATAPPDGCDDLTVYLRHLKNADRMIGFLRETMEKYPQPAGFCWYGDHVPIMPAVYGKLGAPKEVEYVFWSNRAEGTHTILPMEAHDLSPAWLRTMGVAR